MRTNKATELAACALESRESQLSNAYQAGSVSLG